MRLLLGSGGLRSEERVRLYHDLMRTHFEDVSEIIFIPYASNNHAKYTERIREFSAPSGVNIRGIEEFEDPIEAIDSAQGVYMGGGNTFLLVRDLHQFGLLEPIRKRVLQGMPYMGVSAGANVACPTMQTTNDMPIVSPSSFETLGLVPFQINPHYHDGRIWMKDGDEFYEHFGETRSQRISEFHQQNEIPVLGLWEGAFIKWDGTNGNLIGGDGTVFKPNMEPETHPEGTFFDGSLNPQ
ncbi:MAG: dipeptidase PepE [Candidatus Thermoplasmatota archaeon]|nr:dipeptidase PepE [Candidatus Thermoplasmatota archaeon]